MKLVTATPNALYADTDEILTPATCALLMSKGVRGVWRYLSGLAISELALILAAGLELHFVNYAHPAGWLPSAAGGAADAQRDLACLAKLGVPTGVHVAFDLEGPGGTATDVISHVNAHATGVRVSSYLPALYVGEGSMLTSKQLYMLASQLYWASCSDLRDGPSGLVPLCDYSVIQGRPFDVTLDDGHGTKAVVDYDYVKQDLQGRLPIGVVA